MKTIAKSISKHFINVVYRLLLLISVKTAFRFTSFAKRMGLVYPNSISVPAFAPVWIKTNYGEVLCSPDDWVGYQLGITGVWEPTLTETITKLVGKGDYVIDIGAHVGYHSLCASHAVGESGRVLSIELLPYNLHSLTGAVIRNRISNIIPVGIGLASANSLSVIHAGEAGNLGQSTIRSNNGAGRPCLLAAASDLIPLDIWKNTKLIKMDVEGAESLVIEGLEPLLDVYTPPYFICEVTEEYLKQLGSSAQDLIGKMRLHHYRPYYVEKRSNRNWNALNSDHSFEQQIDVLFVAEDIRVEFDSYLSGLQTEEFSRTQEVSCA